jgi:hypothetical protein
MQRESYTEKSVNKPYKEYNPPKIKSILETDTKSRLSTISTADQQNTEKVNKQIGIGLTDALKSTKKTTKTNVSLTDAFEKLSLSPSKIKKTDTIPNISTIKKTDQSNKNVPKQRDITDVILDTSTDVEEETKTKPVVGFKYTPAEYKENPPEKNIFTESFPFVTPTVKTTPTFSITTPVTSIIPPISKTKNPISPFGFYFPEGVGGYGSRGPSSRNILAINPITTRKSAANISNELVRSISSMNMSDLSNISLGRKSTKNRKRK